ncbi:AEC family transporter [Sphingobacterium sp. SRCM116780]|uniref:AEC family transporter n=1 Tax=Sphingobacterium sp. SRCM116780 TaxID=2907623 RepID=UPI001F28CA08|nr:AEC family transporter [Sphingobacterium sp. SRCM116780]UIR55722.1 AEC family transporter [Sphingobacterium sp. SRCM116780]
MVNFVLIIFCICAGMLFKHFKLIPENAYKSINIWVLYIALPAVSFKYIPQITWSTQLLFPVISPIIVFAGSWLFMEIYCRYKGYSQRSRSTLELSAAYSNTSFIGFPLIIAYYGEQNLSIAIICDQVNFMLLATAGIICAIKGDRSNKEGIKTTALIKRLLTFPPFIACVAALILSQLANISISEPFFDKIAATVGPLALFSVGLQLQFKGLKQEISQISVTLLYKLILAPLLVLLAALCLGIHGDIARVSIMEAAMPTLITASMVVQQFRLNTKLINLVIGLGIILSLLTTAMWSYIIAFFI